MSHPDDHPSRAELSADAHEEGIEAAARALHNEYWPDDEEHYGPHCKLCRPRAERAIDAYLEALNAH